MKEVCKNGNFYQWNRLLLKYRTQRLKKGANKIQLNILKEFLTTDSVFFDIGANKGLFTYWAAKYIRDNADLHVFEPQPELAWIYNKIQKKFQQHQIIYNNVGLSDVVGKAHIKRVCIGDGSATLEKSSEEAEKNQSISLETLDIYCKKKAVKKIDFIKIDVEGHEHKTIAGAIKNIEKFKPIMLIEMNPSFLSNKTLNLFQNLEYKVKMIRAGNTFDSSSKEFKNFNTEKQFLNSHADFLFYR
jgi:FkbM family methyltransferase